MRNIGPFFMRDFVNILRVAGGMLMVAGFLLFMVLLAKLNESSPFSSSGLTGFEFAGALLAGCLFLSLGLLHVGMAQVLHEVTAAEVQTARIRRGLTELHEAVLNNNETATEALLTKGASVDATTQAGETPLLLASEIGNPRIVKALLECGANANGSPPHSLKPLDVAVRCGHLEAVELLVAGGATIEHEFLGKSHVGMARTWRHRGIATFLRGCRKNA